MKLNSKQFNTLIRRIFNEEKNNTKKTLKESVEGEFRTRDLEDIDPEAYAALPSSYQNDDALTFYYDVNGNLCAEHDLHKDAIFIWDPIRGEWLEGDSGVYFESKKMKTKTTLTEVRKIIREEVVRYGIKRCLTEAVKKYFTINEMVSWGELEKELKTAYDHFKAENPDVKVGDFDFKKVTDSFIQDSEAREMMKNGDADGLVNKALDVLGADVVGDTDVEKHQDDVFGGIERLGDDEVGAAFDRMTKKAG